MSVKGMSEGRILRVRARNMEIGGRCVFVICES